MKLKLRKLKRRQRSSRKTFEKNKWYDLIEDWGLIEASFTAQYGIRLRNEPDMSWSEFSTLLAGIMPKTPLGQIVSIRSEEDENMLKNFTKEQHRIRNEWRNRYLESMSDQEMEKQKVEIQEMIKKAFGV